ncbi:MAG: hypothetical protein ACRD0M_05205, partial [Acidimicrobiales bacterium]
MTPAVLAFARLAALEFSRALARKLVRALAGVAALAVVVTGIVVFLVSEAGPGTAALLQRAGVEHAARLEQCNQAPPADAPCEEVVGAVENFLPALPDQARNLSSGLLWAAPFLAVAGFGLGASLAGAEWRYRTMAMLLAW